MFMAYTPNDFQPGDILTASHLNAINKQIQLTDTVVDQVSYLANPVVLKKNNQTHQIVISTTGLTPGHKYRLQLMRQPKSLTNFSQWIPVTTPKTIIDRETGKIKIEGGFGYAKLAGTYVSHDKDVEPMVLPCYGDVPAWMPNDGYLTAYIDFIATDSAMQHTILPNTFFLPMVRPEGKATQDRVFIYTQNSEEIPPETEYVRLIGIKEDAPYHTIPFCFWLYDITESPHPILISKNANALYINGAVTTRLADTKEIASNNFYVATSDEKNKNIRLYGLRTIIK